MIKTISLEQYSKYDLNWVSYTSEQWKENGLSITFTLEYDDDYYYLTVCSNDANEYFYNENPDYDRTPLIYTEKWCDEFGCKICDTLDEVNQFIEEELPGYCKFVEGEDGNIYGN